MSDNNENGSLFGGAILGLGFAAMAAAPVVVAAFIYRRWHWLGLAVFNACALAMAHCFVSSTAEAATDTCAALGEHSISCAFTGMTAGLEGWPWFWLHVASVGMIAVAMVFPLNTSAAVKERI
jgi:hypothetical protein